MTKIFLDSGDLKEISALHDKVDGFTCNPTILHRAGVTDFEGWSKEALELTDKPLSLEVFSDDLSEMYRQAKVISSWGRNVFVKIPIVNSKGDTTVKTIGRLLADGIKLNVTAVMTPEQASWLRPLFTETPCIVSLFCGRIADTGRDPVDYMRKVKDITSQHLNVECLWASPREVLNIYQAEKAGSDIITCTPELIAKYEKMKAMDLDELSRQTSEMFYNDGIKAQFKL